MLLIDSAALTHGEAENFFPKSFPRKALSDNPACQDLVATLV